MTADPKRHDSLPTQAEINVFDSLDERCASDHFLGKNLEEAETLFRDDFFNYQEDLMFMGPRAYCYYVHAAIRYLRSPDAVGNDDAASTFAGVLEFWLQHQTSETQPIAADLADVCRYIVDNFDKFQCDDRFDRGLRGRYEALKRGYAQLAASQP